METLEDLKWRYPWVWELGRTKRFILDVFVRYRGVMTDYKVRRLFFGPDWRAFKELARDGWFYRFDVSLASKRQSSQDIVDLARAALVSRRARWFWVMDEYYYHFLASLLEY